MSYTSTTLRTAIKEFTDYTETSFVSNLNLFITNAEQRIFTEANLEFFTKIHTGSMTSGNAELSVPTDFISSNSLSITTAGSESFLQQKENNYVRMFRGLGSGTPNVYARRDIDTFVLAPTPDANYTIELSYYYRPASLTASLVTVTMTSVSGTFQAAETVTGATSGASTTINARVDANNITVVVPITAFTVGETVTGATSGATGVVSSVSADTTKTWLSDNYPNAVLYASLVEAYTYMKGEPDLINLYENRYQQQVSRLKELGNAREQNDAFRRGRPDQMRS